ncbi:unnamed protein product [Mytilus coruscus]|uniref:SAP domain-containing protein n=1 Tax=Mytilus coruscus TaxID=42192 RepID=A0A6J8DKS6_MYTCO|nr:unnamed protein product [Mytilus coruscus]
MAHWGSKKTENSTASDNKEDCDFLQSTGPCVRPDKMKLSQLKKELENRGLSITGSNGDLISRLETDDGRESILELVQSIGGKMTEDAFDLVLKYLGLDKHFQTGPCNVQEGPKECPLGTLGMPDLPDNMACHFKDTCTGIECCIEIPGIGLTLHPFIIIDPCEYTLNYGVNTINETIQLINYEWEFSLSEWADRVGTDIKSQLKTEFRTLLLEQLGLDVMLKNPSCNRTDNMYSPSVNGWNNECSTLTPPALSGPASCYIPDYCTGIDCCLDFDYLDLHLNFYLYVDTCNYVIRGGIEKFTFEYQLLDYQWGETQIFTLMDIIYLEYSIHDLKGENSYMLNGKIKVCLQKGGRSCLFTKTLFENAKIQKFGCDWSHSEFKIPGCQKTLPFNLPAVPNTMSCHLTDTCTVCPSNVPLQDLTGSLSCTIPDYCTGIDCCVEIPQIGRTFHVYLLLDACSHRLKIGIENLGLDQAYFNFEFDFSPSKLLQDSGFSIADDLPDVILSQVLEKIGVIDYLLTPECDLGDYTPSVNGWINKCPLAVPFPDLTIPASCYMPSHCTAVDCCIDVDFLHRSFHTYIDLNTYFSLEKYTADAGEVLNSLKEPFIQKLMEDLGISSYLSDDPCNITSEDYTPNHQGWKSEDFTPNHQRWKSECTSSYLTLTLPSSVSCVIPPSCSALSCCMDFQLISRAIMYEIHIDPCTYTMSLTLEKLHVKISLLKYTWGETHKFSLQGGIIINYKIDEFYNERMFIVSLNISICYEANGPCALDLKILENSKLPIPFCDFSQGIPGFKFNSWLTDHDLSPSLSQLSDLMASKLLEDLGIAEYLQEPSCNPATDIAFSNVQSNGWNSACPRAVLPNLPDDVVCHLDSTCTSVTCCALVGLINRNIHFFLTVDPCNQTFSLGIEKYQFEFSLYETDFNLQKQFHIGRVLEIDYMISDMAGERVYYMDLSIKVCFNDEGPCLIQANIFSNTKLPKIQCSWRKGFFDPDFSLAEFVSDSGLSTLDSFAVSKLMDYLGVSDYLLSEQCDVTQLPYNSSVNGWTDDFSLENFLSSKGLSPKLSEVPTEVLLQLSNKLGIASFYVANQCNRVDTPYIPNKDGWNNDCDTLTSDLPLLPGTTVCHIQETCTLVSCCFSVDKIGQSFQASVDIDPCRSLLTVTIEKFRLQKNLLDFQWGTPVEMWLFGLLRLEYKIMDLDDDQYKVDMNMSICYTDTHPCDYSIHLWTDTQINKTMCELAAGFLDSGKTENVQLHGVYQLRLDPSDLQGGFRNLYNDLASSEQVQEFLKEAKDYELSEFIDKLLGDPTNIFKRTDIIVKGDVSFPRTNVVIVPPIYYDIPVGPLILRLGSDPFNKKVLDQLFTGAIAGRLVGPKSAPDTIKSTPGDCARACADLPPTKCMSFNYDFGKGVCELMEAIEGHHYSRSKSGLFEHYERLGIGKSKQFVYENLQLLHNKLYYFNLRLVNVLGYYSIITTPGVIVDTTTPETGFISNKTADYLEILPCLDLIPGDRPDWKLLCKGVNPKIQNHRLVVDGPGSQTVFNGPTPMFDLKFTRANAYIAVDLRKIGVADQALIVDNTPPIAGQVLDGSVQGTDLQFTKEYQKSDVTSLSSNFEFIDEESGLDHYKIQIYQHHEGVRSQVIPGGTDIMSWTAFGTEKDIYIPDLTLQLTDLKTYTPVYYVSVKAENGAGQESNPVTSTPIVVVDEDKPGMYDRVKVTGQESNPVTSTPIVVVDEDKPGYV